MCACEMSISSPAPYTSAIRTRIAIASCGAGPRRPSSMSRSVGVRCSIRVVTIMRRMRKMGFAAVAAMAALVPVAGRGEQRAHVEQPDVITVLKPARVFDGAAVHEGWAVRVKGQRIDAVGPEASVAAAGAKVIELPGTTLTPGLVEGHSHILLHAYSETSWTDQVSKEGLALRVARATNHLRATLLAGFTTIRDLGTEGAQYADVELKQAVNQGIIPGPRILASTKAIVATGSYQPKTF